MGTYAPVCDAFTVHMEDPHAGPRGLAFGLLGGLLSWAALAAAVLLFRRHV